MHTWIQYHSESTSNQCSQISISIVWRCDLFPMLMPPISPKRKRDSLNVSEFLWFCKSLAKIKEKKNYELQFFFNAPIYREPKFQRVKWTNSKWANQMHIYYSFSAEITLLVDFYFIPVHFISIFISMLCMPIGRARLLHECEHKTRSRSRAIWNCACPLIVCMRYCVVLWKLDAHQPVKPPFSTALNKTMRFIRSRSEVKCCAVLFALLHTSHLRLRHFSIFYSRFRCTFAVCAFLLNESISIHCRLVLLICIAFTALVCSHNLCAEYTHTAFMLLLTDQHFLIQTTWNIRKKGANR